MPHYIQFRRLFAWSSFSELERHLRGAWIYNEVEMRRVLMDPTKARIRDDNQQPVLGEDIEKAVTRIENELFDSLHSLKDFERYLQINEPTGRFVTAATSSRNALIVPAHAGSVAPRRPGAVDLDHHSFDVALSFPGETRRYVTNVAAELEKLLGPHRYFFDSNYAAQLARPAMDVLLQSIYRDRSRLIVVFLSSHYQRKDWCGLELRVVRNIVYARDHQRIMYVRMDDGEVEGVLNTDGYLDGRRLEPEAIARHIFTRVQLLGTSK